MSYSRALVTGGAGFIGSHLAEALLAEGLDVVVLDNLSVGKRENVPQDARLIVGDIRDPEDLTKSLEGVDIVFHEAARVSIRSSVEDFYDDADNNLVGTLKLLRALQNSEVKKLVYASSMAVYADSETPSPIDIDYATEPISPYGISKLASERFCLDVARTLGIDCVVLRYFNTYGPRQTFTPYVGVITIFTTQLLRGERPTIFGDGEQRRDFVHVLDIVQANVLAMRADTTGGVFNVGTGTATSVNQIGDMLCSRISPAMECAHGPDRPGELRNSIADITKTTNHLGYKPKYGLRESIDDVIEWIKESS